MTRAHLTAALAAGLVIALGAPARAGGAKGGPKKFVAADAPPAEVAALASPEVETAAHAAEQLGASASPGAHDALLDALAIGLPPAVAVPAMTGLAQHPAPPDVAALRRYAGHHTPGVRIAALTALALYPTPDAQAAIIAGLHDPVGMVRTAAAAAAGKGRVKAAVEPLLALLAKGEDSAARALAQLADADLARTLGDQLGKVPDASLVVALGGALKRPDFGPDEARTQIVRALAKIQDASVVSALTDYLDATANAKDKTRTSRTEAQMVVEGRLGGGK